MFYIHIGNSMKNYKITINDFDVTNEAYKILMQAKTIADKYKINTALNGSGTLGKIVIDDLTTQLYGSRVIIVGETGDFKTLDDASSFISGQSNSYWTILLQPQNHIITNKIYFKEDYTIGIIGLDMLNTKLVSDVAYLTFIEKEKGNILFDNIFFEGTSSNIVFQDSNGTGTTDNNNVMFYNCMFYNCSKAIVTKDDSMTALLVNNCRFDMYFNTAIEINNSPGTVGYSSNNGIFNCGFHSTTTGIGIYGADITKPVYINACNFDGGGLGYHATGIKATQGIISECRFYGLDYAIYVTEDSDDPQPLITIDSAVYDSNVSDIYLDGPDSIVYILGGQVTQSKIDGTGKKYGWYMDPTTSEIVLTKVPIPSLDEVSISTNGSDEVEIKGFAGAANSTVLTKTAATGILGFQTNLIDAGYANSLHKHKNTDYTKVLVVAPTANEGDYTDIATALAAFTGLSTSARGLLIIQPGTYTISAGIAMVQYVDIVGVSRETVIITTTGSAIQPIITIASNSRLENLTVLGRYNTVNDYGVYTTSANDSFVMHNVRIKNCQVGFRNSSATNLTVTNCALDECEYFFDLMGNSKDHFIDGVTLTRTAAYGTRGLYLNGTFTYLQLSNIKIKGALTTAVSINATTGAMLNNVVVWNATTAFTSANAADVVMLGNCAAYSCTTDLITNAAGGRLELSGGYYTAAKITDAGIGIPASKGITGGYFDLASHVWTTR
jgi:hypothetical protein